MVFKNTLGRVEPVGPSTQLPVLFQTVWLPKGMVIPPDVTTLKRFSASILVMVHVAIFNDDEPVNRWMSFQEI